MSNTVRVRAIARCNTRIAKWRPGQILTEASGLVNSERNMDYGYLRPEPKTLDSGALTEESSRPSLSRNRVGS